MLFLGILIFTLVLGLLSGSLIGISLNYIRPSDIFIYSSQIFNSPYYRFITFFVGLLIFLLWIYFLERIFLKKQKEKTIAFQTPAGQVSIALSAVEDFIKRLCEDIPELKEIRPAVSASRRGVNISLRLLINPLQDLPQFTSNLQNFLKDKIQSLLGLEEEINIKIHIAKIMPLPKKKKEKETEENVGVPYREF